MMFRLIGTFLLARAASVSAQTSCTLCQGNAAPANGNSSFFGTITCDEIAALPLSAENCTDLEDVNAAFICGCPGAEAGTCPGICPDGAPVGLPDLEIPGESPVSCEVWDLYTKATSNDTLCAIFADPAIATYCGCPGSANATCTGICANGQPVPDPNLSVFDLYTCGVLDNSARFLNETECADPQTQAFAAACGCDGANSTLAACTLCPGNAAPANGDFLVAEGASCSLIAQNAPLIAEAECPDFVGSSLSAICGCPGLEPGTCAGVCPDGSPVGLPDVVISDNATCGFVDSIAMFVSNDTLCAEFQQPSTICGCPGVPQKESCSLCEDGSELPDPTFPVIANSQTCSDVADDFLFNSSIAECSAIQATAGVYCMCNNPIASATACRICGGTTLLPDPSQLVTADQSCGVVEFNATLGVDLTCAEYQSMYAETCCGASGNETVAPAVGLPTVTMTAAPVTVAPSATTASNSTTSVAPVSIAPVSVAPVSAAPSSMLANMTVAPVLNVTSAPVASPTAAPVTKAPTSGSSGAAGISAFLGLWSVAVVLAFNL